MWCKDNRCRYYLQLLLRPFDNTDDPIIKRELDKHGLRAHLYPFAAVKEDGAIAYVASPLVWVIRFSAPGVGQSELTITP